MDPAKELHYFTDSIPDLSYHGGICSKSLSNASSLSYP
jgi:hypothetical protein